MSTQFTKLLVKQLILYFALLVVAVYIDITLNLLYTLILIFSLFYVCHIYYFYNMHICDCVGIHFFILFFNVSLQS